jgi:hypothetical protein
LIQNADTRGFVPRTLSFGADKRMLRCRLPKFFSLP